GRLAALADAQAKAQGELTRTLNERLEQVSQNMGTSLKETSTKTFETLGNLTARLALIDEAQKNITALSAQVVGLQDILANRQARGAFGEIQLQDIVTNALPPSAYAFQATLKGGARADCLIHLPNPPGSIAIDAKFPLDAYRLLRAAKDEAERVAAQRQFRADLLKHVADISTKYIVPGETAESALMFLPSEAVYAELHANFADVVTKSYQARVWIVSPTTLMATLNTVRAVLKDVEMRKQAGVIQKYVGLLLQDVGRLGGRVENLEKHFGQAEKDLREIRTSADAITKRGEKIHDVELGEAEAQEALAPARVERDLLTSE
ncbi:MAG TPA: DNA recombination protein RmuC, partial [Parvibaculum sp.]